MNSVRLRLLVLALAPLTILMPLLLLAGMVRWGSDYDDVLHTNVEADLRVAEQYLTRIMAGTGKDLNGIAESVRFANVLEQNITTQRAFFEQKRDQLELDFLYYLSMDEALQVVKNWPVISAAASGISSTEIDIFSQSDLMALATDLPQVARIDLIDTEAATPSSRTIEGRGMVVHAASPVKLSGREGVLIGGILLNRNLQFIDTINALVYLNAVTGGDRQGTATLFLEDVRISTNVRLFEDVRALGTRVSAEVRQEVLGNGHTWIDRAFVVNDWYVSGYQPIIDSFGNRVGMLYVGFLEAPFSAAKKDAYMWMLGAFSLVLLLSAPVFLRMAKGIFSPLERMTQTMRRVGKGNLSARNGQIGRQDEIGEVASHLDDLLNQVQDRDRRLRSWADELNQRVEERTSELQTSNEKLEETYRQLVMSEKLASIGEITAGVAHEVNNPVAVIQGNVDVIRDVLGEQADCIETELDLIDKQVMRIDAIVGKLLKFTRPSEYCDVEQSVALGPLVIDCLILVEHVLSRSNITVETHFDAVPTVRIDTGEMQQVAVNLIMNAAQAMGQSGQLTLRLEKQTRDNQLGVLLRVKDTGNGIDLAHIDAVFDPFYTTKMGEGTGLGLSISQNLVQQAGGIITVNSKLAIGTEFKVWLPAEDQ